MLASVIWGADTRHALDTLPHWDGVKLHRLADERDNYRQQLEKAVDDWCRVDRARDDIEEALSAAEFLIAHAAIMSVRADRAYKIYGTHGER